MKLSHFILFFVLGVLFAGAAERLYAKAKSLLPAGMEAKIKQALPDGSDAAQLADAAMKKLEEAVSQSGKREKVSEQTLEPMEQEPSETKTSPSPVTQNSLATKPSNARRILLGLD